MSTYIQISFHDGLFTSSQAAALALPLTGLATPDKHLTKSTNQQRAADLPLLSQLRHRIMDVHMLIS
jgi:hypothetical protein